MDFLRAYAHQVVSYHPERARDELFEELHSELCEEYEDWHVEHPDSDIIVAVVGFILMLQVSGKFVSTKPLSVPK